MLNKPFAVLISISILLGLILFFSPGFIFCLIVTSCLFYVSLKNTPSEDKKFVFTILLAALVLRLILLTGIQYYCLSRGLLDIFGDASDNILRGQLVERYLKEELTRLPFPLRLGIYNVHTLIFLNGIFLAYFKNDIFSLKYLNILCSLLSGWLIYDYAKNLFNSQIGKIAMGIVLFWPTLFIWSITDLKDCHFVLAVIGILWSLHKFTLERNLRRRIIFLLFTFAFSIYFVTLRNFLSNVLIFYFAIIIFYFIFRLCAKKGLLKGYKMFFLTIFICSILLLFKEKIYGAIILAYDSAIALNRGFLSSGGFNYDLLSGSTNVYTVPFFLKFFLSSLAHFLLEPLPWHYYSVSMLTILPLMLFWYLMLLASTIGIVKICRFKKAHAVFPLLFFLIVCICAFGASISNIGTAVRFRDSIMPLIAILAACGVASVRG